MVRIYSYEAGKTLGAHKAFLQKLTKRGAQMVNSPQESDVTIVFCPIVSRFESDVASALSKITELDGRSVILVLMHHTFKPDYTVPDSRELDHPVALAVDCLFHEKKGLLVCPRNKKAYNSVRDKLDLQPQGCFCLKQKKENKISASPPKALSNNACT